MKMQIKDKKMRKVDERDKNIFDFDGTAHCDIII
jgi:hypothetical protein